MFDNDESPAAFLIQSPEQLHHSDLHTGSRSSWVVQDESVLAHRQLLAIETFCFCPPEIAKVKRFFKCVISHFSMYSSTWARSPREQPQFSTPQATSSQIAKRGFGHGFWKPANTVENVWTGLVWVSNPSTRTDLSFHLRQVRDQPIKHASKYSCHS